MVGDRGRIMTKAITTKTATADDHELIRDIYESAREFGKRTGSCDWSEDYPNDEILESDITQSDLYIVFMNDEPAAVFSLIATDDLDHEPLDWAPVNSGVPVRICIRADLQGKGLGKAVMNELMRIARERGYESLRLLAATSNKPANRLYTGLGFTHKGTAALYNKEFNAYELLLSETETAGR